MVHSVEAVFGGRLKAERQAQRIALRDLAATSGVSFNAISRYERHAASPDLGACVRLASALGYSLDDFLRSGDSMITVYASIGNSDDKLNQVRWSAFCRQFVHEIRNVAKVHGIWYSAPDAAYQNACVCFDIGEESAGWLAEGLSKLCAEFGQDSIAWAVAETEFISADGEAAAKIRGETR